MCFLCAVSGWSRRVMLPWLVVPFIVVCALSQLLPPNYRLEITSSRLACLGVLLLSLVWYEILMPWMSSWRARKRAVQRERKLIEALEAAKWRKEATRRCRNCLSAYKVQMPGSGKYVCTYCGHISKRPVLEVAGNLANSRLTMSGSGVTNGANMSHMRGVCQRIEPLTAWYRAAERNRCAWLGESSHLPNECSSSQSFPVLILKQWIFLWRKLLGIGESTTDGCPSMNGSFETMADASSSRLEKTRRKADKKKQARLQKELLEAEDRKQREEVASLVEERRRQRDEIEILQQKERELNTEKQKETQKDRANDKRIEKSGRESGKSDTTWPFDQQLECAGPVQGATKDVGDKLAVSSSTSKEQNNVSITISKSSRVSEQSHLSKCSTMDRISRLGFLQRSGTTAPKTSITASKANASPQNDNISRDKKESAFVGKLRSPSGCSNSSFGAAGDAQVAASAWKRAPWINAWVKRGKEPALDSNFAQKEVNNDNRKSLEQDLIPGFDSSNSFLLTNKSSLSLVRATASQPPIAPPSNCADPLQQLFSTPSLFPPIDLCANVNHSSGQSSETEAKHVFLIEHMDFEAPNFTPSTDLFMDPFAYSFIQSTSENDAPLPQTAISSSLRSFDQTNLASQCSLLTDTSCEYKPGYTEGFTNEMPSCDIMCVSDVATSTGTAISLLGSEKVVDLDTWTDNSELWENAEEEAVPLSTVEALLGKDLFTSDASLSSPQKSASEKLREDVRTDTWPVSDQNSLFSSLNTRVPVWEDADCSQKLPAEFVDCITQEIMQDPVITADGHSYERTAIEKWLRHHDTSPKTGEVLPPPPGGIGVDKTLRPNHILRGQIIEYKEKLTRTSESQWTTLSKPVPRDAASIFNMTISPRVLSF